MTTNEAINKVLDIARAEIGYREKASNGQLDNKAANSGSGNFTKYARDLDTIPNFYNGKKNGFAWCDMFNDWCHYKAWGVNLAMKVLCQPQNSAGAGCLYSAKYYKNAGRWHTSDPQPGDQIFFSYAQNEISHTGIVESVSGANIVTIEGNTSDAVARRTYTRSDARIVGYGRPRWELVTASSASKKESASASVSKIESYKPLVCLMTQSTCYRQTSPMTIKGVLWHSTGANNPWIRRYVQPDDNASNKAELLAKIGSNQYKNDWNHITVQAGLNAWIGKLADGTVAAVQTMPWNYKPWGCGGGCNNGWIQFEICESDLDDKSYFNAVYQEGVKLTAYLCKLYNIDPYGKVGSVPTILCHQDSYRYGMGSNHADVYHWFNRHGKTMDDVRNDVATLLGTTSFATATSSERRDLGKGDEGDDVKQLQENLIKLGYSLPKYGADGDFGAETDDAVRLFQSKNWLRVDGIVGEKTHAAIEKLLRANVKSVNTTVKWTPAVGDIVRYKGNVHYFGANSALYSPCKGGVAKITKIYQPEKSKHPYHLLAVRGKGSTVYGWVNAGTFEKI